MPHLTPITKREQVSGQGLIAFDAIIESRGIINAPQLMHQVCSRNRSMFNCPQRLITVPISSFRS